MIHGQNGYCLESSNRDAFRAAVKRLAVDLPKVMLEAGATAIAVRGKSGVSMAFAISMVADLDFIIVRKPGENSHGQTTEVIGQQREHEKYIVLDDFMASGATISAIMDQLGSGNCKGVLLYQGASDLGYKITGYSARTAIVNQPNPVSFYTYSL